MSIFGKPRFDRLLSPYQIGRVRLRNRMVKPSQAMGLASEDGYVTEANLGFYETLARGGVGLIVVEHSFPDYPMGVSGLGRLAISDDKYIPGLGKLTQAIHKHSTPCFIQLGHTGPAQYWRLPPGQAPVSSSSLNEDEKPYPVRYQPRGLSISEIKELTEKYARAAERAREAGFDGLEIHCAHNYLLNSFLSCAWNKRTDEYGCQDYRSRARFAVEVLQTIKTRLGQDFPVGVRVNGAEYGLKNGLTSQDSQEFARILQEAGADYISVTAWGGGPYDWLLFPEELQYPEPVVPLTRKIRKPGALVPPAEAIKKVVSVPVIVVGRLDATLGEWLLKKGMADLIGLGRRLLADPDYPNKIASGRLDDIAPCTACLECISRVSAGERIRCRINAALGREYELAIKPTAQRKRVVVVGGGPAGMEAARLATSRGHEVILYEKGHGLGGLMPLAALIKGTDVEDLPAIVSYLKRQLRKLGVQVRLNTEFNAALLEEVKPDVVIIASGGTLTKPEIPGIGRPNVVTSAELHKKVRPFLRFFGPKVLRWLTGFYLPFGKRVVIVGGLIHGCETAEFLVKHGRKVTITETSDKLGRGMPEVKRGKLLAWLAAKGVVMLTGVTYEAVTEEGLIIARDGKRQLVQADTVLVTTPPLPNTTLFDALKDKVNQVYLIGDSKEPRSILEAISDGSEIGRMV